MNPDINSGAGGLLAVVTGLFGLVVTIFWMWVGWRAMRAHERIADSLQETGHAAGRPDPRAR
jgi:hypothetical protein